MAICAWPMTYAPHSSGDLSRFLSLHTEKIHSCLIDRSNQIVFTTFPIDFEPDGIPFGVNTTSFGWIAYRFLCFLLR